MKYSKDSAQPPTSGADYFRTSEPTPVAWRGPKESSDLLMRGGRQQASDGTRHDSNRRGRVRVLFCECGHRGGSVKQLYRLLTSLDRNRLDMGFVSYYRSSMAEILFRVPGLFCRYKVPIATAPAPDVMKRIGPLLLPTPFALQYLLVAMYTIMIHRPDVVYLNNLPEQHLPMILAARVLRVPVVCHLLATRPLTASDRLGVPHIDEFIMLTRAALSLYVAEGINPTKARVVYNGIPLDEFDRAWNAPPQSFLPAGPVYAIQTATLNENKRPMVAVRALEIARKSCPDLKLVLIGDGEGRAEIERYVADHGLADAVLLLGQRSDVPAILRQCHIGMLLSKREGMPNCVLEYMAARLPVIVTELAGIDEMVVPDETALVISEASPEKVAEALVQLYHDSPRRQRMGAAGRQIIERPPFTQQSALDAIGELIVQWEQK